MRIVINPNEKPKALKVKSPCINYCSASSLADPVCCGCYRNAEDVDKWNTYTEHEKVEALIRSYHNYKAKQKQKEKEKSDAVP
jgi:predicted Fe-S protein YdhL (DUF1289 family)